MLIVPPLSVVIDELFASVRLPPETVEAVNELTLIVPALMLFTVSVPPTVTEPPAMLPPIAALPPNRVEPKPERLVAETALVPAK